VKTVLTHGRERTIIGSVSYQNRYWAYRIESYWQLLYRPILCATLQVQQLLTGCITQEVKGWSRPVTRCTNAVDWPRYGRGGSSNAHCNTAAVN